MKKEENAHDQERAWWRDGEARICYDMRRPGRPRMVLQVHHGGEMMIIPLRKVLYIVVNGNDCTAHLSTCLNQTHGKDSITFRCSLEKIENYPGSGLQRVNRWEAVNLRHVGRLTDSDILFLNHGDQKGLNVSMEYRARLSAALERGIVPLG